LTLIELIWTVGPALVLVAIAFPSFKLLYLMDEVIDPAMTVKVTGHQWYWEYEYADFLNEENETINFDSYMKDDSSLEEGELRMLEVDNPLVLPIDTHIRFIITAADVLHDWAMPTLAIKIDACPGRLNQASVIIERPGYFYGQCSEICLWPDRLFCYGKEKFSLIFPSIGFSVNYDVNLRELNLKYIKANPKPLIVDTYVNYHYYKWQIVVYICILRLVFVINKINKIVVKLVSSERSLTRNRDLMGNVPQKSNLINLNSNQIAIPNLNEIDLETKNIFMQEDILISEVSKVFWPTETESTTIKSTKQSKLGNPVLRNQIMISALEYNSNLQLYSKSLTKKLINGTPRGQDWYQDNVTNNIINEWGINVKKCLKESYPNYHAYKIWNIFCIRLRSKVTCSYSTFRYYSSNSNNVIRPLKDKKLTLDIQKTLSEGKWITTKQKQRLTTYVENVQKLISETTLNSGMYSRKVNYLSENYLHSLLFHTYAIETLSKNAGSKTSGVDNLILDNTFDSKIFILRKLKRFESIGIIPGKRIYIPKTNSNELRPLTIPSIIDRAIQQLFLLVMDPIIDINSDLYSFGFRKGHNQIMAIGHLQKKLQTKPSRGNHINVNYPIIWDVDIRKCFDTINHDWLLSNLPIPNKYKFIFSKWLKSGFIELGKGDINETYQAVPQGGIISPLLMNFALNGMEKIIEESKLEYKKIIKRVSIRNRKEGKILSVVTKSKTDGKFKDTKISCEIIRYADDFLIICGSHVLLDIIKIKIKEFLSIRGLEIHPNKTRTLIFGINNPFNFLGYTFVYLIRTKYIRNKFLMRSTPEYRLKGRPRLYVYPSTEKYNTIKRKIKQILKSSYNLTVYQLISKLNPIIRGWVNYYSFSNSGGTLGSFRKFLYKRLKIFVIKKHKRASIRWLMRQYFLLSSLPEQHKMSTESLIKLNPSILQNKWNFFGLAFKDGDVKYYVKPKINILLWPNKVKKLITATIFTPSRILLSTSWYLNKTGWLKEALKLQNYHSSFDSTLFEKLYKRDGNICYLCKDVLSDDMNNIKEEIHIHHIVPWAETKVNILSNLVLVHSQCHTGWHLEPEGKVTKNKTAQESLYTQNRILKKSYLEK